MATKTYKTISLDGEVTWKIKDRNARPRKTPVLLLLLEEAKFDNAVVRRKGGWKKVIQSDVCSYCNGPGGTLDHIIPKSVIKDNCDWDDYTGACVDCNGRKGDSNFLIFFMNNPKRESVFNV